jgi:predicted ribosome quality control (RQC) complex YloA/Tae2 family protein
MLSLRELRRAARGIYEGFLNARLRRITQPDEHTLVLTFDTSGEKSHLLASIHSEYARISLTDAAGPTAGASSFCEYVRAHLSGCCLSGIDIPREERQVRMSLQSRSGTFVCIFSILGARSNVYLLNPEGKLVHCMRPLEETRRELKIGEDWLNPRGAAPSEGADRWESVPDALYLQAIGKAYHQLEQKRKAELIARRIENAVKKERLFLHRKSLNLQEDLGEAQKAEAYRQKGELLKNVLHSVKTGDDKAWAKDYRTGQVVEIPLDPRLSPAANMEAYFARYQKESRGVIMIQQQLEDLESARAALDQIEGSLTDALEKDTPDILSLESIMAQPAVLRMISRHSARRGSKRRPAKPAEKRRELPARLLPKRYKTEEGLEIWVGRSDEGNDYLTTRLAHGNDLFFHLEAYPGSHVILRTGGRLDPSPSSLLDACELAVHFSKLKAAGSADVHVAPVKDVKKPRGAKPGLVYVRRGKTIHLRRDSKRLQSILAARLDD